jgi:hypothetical protein
MTHRCFAGVGGGGADARLMQAALRDAAAVDGAWVAVITRACPPDAAACRAHAFDDAALRRAARSVRFVRRDALAGLEVEGALSARLERADARSGAGPDESNASQVMLVTQRDETLCGPCALWLELNREPVLAGSQFDLVGAGELALQGHAAEARGATAHHLKGTRRRAANQGPPAVHDVGNRERLERADEQRVSAPEQHRDEDEGGPHDEAGAAARRELHGIGPTERRKKLKTGRASRGRWGPPGCGEGFSGPRTGRPRAELPALGVPWTDECLTDERGGPA